MKKVLILLLTSFLFASILQAESTDPQLKNLRCDYLQTPLGIDNPQPRLSWMLSDSRKDACQLAYRVMVGLDSLDLIQGRNILWNTGIVKDGLPSIVYEGTSLNPFTRYYWQVTVWDKENVELPAAVSSFETGMMDVANWCGSWISDHHNIAYKPAPYFRKEFTAGKEIASARAYIAAGGLFELYINGEKMGDQRLDPMYTRFDRRNLYVTHDVTAALQKGENAIGVLLGNGWYNHQSMAVWDFDRAPWRNRPTFVLDLRITYADGAEEVVSTGMDWKTSGGSLVFNSIYTAEHMNMQLEQSGWSSPGFDDSQWNGIRLRSAPSNQIVAQQLQPIRNVDLLTPVSVERLTATHWLYDFGQNMSGVTCLKIQGEKGDTVRLIHTERLHTDGHADLSNIDVYYRPVDDTDPFQTDIVVLSGGLDEFMPKFNYKGFRYVEVVTESPMSLDAENLTAYFMHSDVPVVGELSSSSDLINKLWEATNNAYLSNLMGYPTDCPQREKNGWTGDGHLAIETALFNFDGITVYEKWMADHRDEQQPNGVLPDIIPTGGWGYGTANGLDWTSTIALIPWNLYVFYGDLKPLKDNYEAMKRYVDYVDRTSPSGLTSWGRGDWVPVKSHSSLELTSSVYFYVDADIVAQAAQLLGKDDDARYYRALARKIKNAINQKYLNRSTGIYAQGTQTELSVPLKWGVVPEDMIPMVAANLAKTVEASDFHLDVGVLGAKALLDALSQNGYVDAAYKVAVQNTYPSWGWWIVNGATTLLENWDLEAERDISDNHMMFGEIGAWMFKGIGGIRPDSKQPGFKHFTLNPYFAKELDHFEVEHQSMYGTIVSGWKRKGNIITYSIEVPPSTTATLQLPENIKGEKTLVLTSGRHVLNLQETKR